MTGHQHRKQFRARQPAPADPLLDQLAQHVAVARASGNAAVAKLAEAEAAFTAGVLSRLEGVDAPTVGAVLLAAGYYAGEFLKTLVGTDGPTAAASTLNVIQLAGQQLYTARVKSKAVCGLPWPSGKACTQAYEADDDETLAAMMRGHAALSHPGQEWDAHAGDGPPNVVPIAPVADAVMCGQCGKVRAIYYHALRGNLCASCYDETPDLCEICGKPSDGIVGTLYTDGRPGDVKALCRDCERANAQAAAMPRHAPYEVCDCRPGETYHCAAAADGEAR